MNLWGKNGVVLFSALALMGILSACSDGDSNSSQVIYYPYETVYGSVCSTMQPTPGCTFNRSGTRVAVNQDSDYNKYGNGSNDMWYVKFKADGSAEVYNDLGVYQYTTNVSQFAGYVSGNTIGVGNTGWFWEDVSNNTYWLGNSGVLYSANSDYGNYGEAINNGSGKGTGGNFSGAIAKINDDLIDRGAEMLADKFDLSHSKAIAVASSLNGFAVDNYSRGFVTDKELNQTFDTVFGVNFNSALAAVKDLQKGNKESMRRISNRTAEALGLKSSQAQEFIKGMYSQAFEDYGIEKDQFDW